MVRTNETRRGEDQIQFALSVLGGTRLQRPRRTGNGITRVVERAASPYELNISGSQLLIWFLLCSSLLSLFAWGLLRFWLFAQ
jgi:hypothetical protein